MDCQWSPVNWICLLANTSEGNLHRNKSLICVPKETKGVSVAKQINKIRYFCSDTAQLFFEDVVVPKSYIIGEEGKGFTYQMMQFQEERMWGIFSCEYQCASSAIVKMVIQKIFFILYSILGIFLEFSEVGRGVIWEELLTTSFLCSTYLKIKGIYILTEGPRILNT